MPSIPHRAAALIVAGVLALSAAAPAQIPPPPDAPPAPQQATPNSTQGEDIAKDPAVRESLPPENTPLGRNPPNLHTGQSDPGLQKSIDDAHRGTTGTTRSEGTLTPGDRPDQLRDGSAPRTTVPAQ